MGGANHLLHPIGTSFIRDDFEIKIKPGVKTVFAFISVAINKITRIGHLKPFATKQPLIDLHLPLIGLAVFRVQRNYGVGTGRDRKSTRLNSSHSSISYALFFF